jgi:hypothetical protein
MSEQELVRLQRVGDRLISTFSALIEQLPADARGISGMARYLGVHKATCQRIVEGAQQSDDALAAFLRFPGVRALRLHLKACRKRAVDGAVVEACEAAVRQFDDELEHYQVSHRGLIDLIASLRAAEDGGDSALHRRRAMEQRRALFGAARRLTGEETEAKVVVAIIRPAEVNEDRLAITVACSLLGVSRETFARPIVPFILAGHHPEREGRAADEAPAKYQLLPKLSTTGLRTVRLAGSGGRTLLVVETEGEAGARGGEPVDVSLLFRTAAQLNPAKRPGERITAAVRVTQPTHHLLADVYVDRRLPIRAMPVGGCFALTAPPGNAPDGGADDCWFDRFPESVGIAPLSGFGGSGRMNPTQKRASELARLAFEADALDREDFVAFRTEVKYPVWQSEYRVYLSD